MRRLLPGLAIPILVAVPLWVAMSWSVGVIAATSGALCIAAVLRASLSLATAGGAFALISLALALRESSSSINMLLPAVFGLALVLLADGTDFCKRYDGAVVSRVLWHRYVAWWLVRAAIALGIAMVVAIVASLIAMLLPRLGAPFLAGIGVLAALAAAVTFAWPSSED